MDGFKRPNRPVEPRQAAPRQRPLASYEQRLAANTPHYTRPIAPQQPVPAEPAQHPVTAQPPNNLQLPDVAIADEPKQKTRRRHPIRIVIIGLLSLLVIGGIAAFFWYQDALDPANVTDKTGKDFTVNKGETLSAIAARLEKMSLIKNQFAFQVYARMNNMTNMPEGNCVVKGSQSASQIAATLVKGCNEFKSIMFYPGATIEKPLYKPEHAELDQDTMYIRYRLEHAGFNGPAIDAALSKQYTGPLFADKPAGTSLEGYIYGDTYHVDVNATADKVLQVAFDQMYKDIQANDLVAKFKSHNLNLYQGITLASIVQRELNCEGKPTEERRQRCYGYQQTIAQVFLKRLEDNTTLGSDVTFIYAADMKGVTPTPDLDSLYNTRVHPGLPPGPIASPGLLALKAVGNPSATDYNFFIAGDDGLIYFARTLAEHEANVKNHCQMLCNDL